MAIVINGSGTVTGISVGGLPDGIVDAGTLATNSVDSAELIDGSIDTAHIAADQITAAILPAGSILQTLFFQYASAQTISNDSGDGASSGLTLAITPIATSSKILAFWNMSYQLSAASGGGSGFGVKLMRGGTVVYVSTATWLDLANPSDGDEHHRASWMHLDSPSTTSATTYTVNVLTEGGGAVLFNHDNEKTQLVLMEVAG